MGKMVIPGWVYMVLGVIVILYTKFIERKTDESLVLFFVVGICFVAFGFIREVIWRIRGKKSRKRPTPHPPPQEEHVHAQKHPAGNRFHGQSPHETHAHTQPAKHPHHAHQPPTKRCPQCHHVTPLHAKACHNCQWQFY